MKKILVLSMYCNAEFFIKEEQTMRECWAEDIVEGKYAGIDFYSYTASSDGKYHVDFKNRRLYVPCDDGRNGTFEKTVKALRFVKTLGITYDCLIRTNTSVFINMPILRQFADTLYDADIAYCGKLRQQYDHSGPYEYDCFGQGNLLILSARLADVVSSRIDGMFEYMETHSGTVRMADLLSQEDDAIIGCAINASHYSIGFDAHMQWKCVGIADAGDSCHDIANSIAVCIKTVQSDGDGRNDEIRDYYRIKRIVRDFGRAAAVETIERIPYMETLVIAHEKGNVRVYMKRS